MAYLNVAYVSPNAMNDLVLWSITGATRTAAAVTPREGVTHSTSVAVAHRARTAVGPKKHPASRAAAKASMLESQAAAGAALQTRQLAAAGAEPWLIKAPRRSRAGAALAHRRAALSRRS